MDVMKATYEQQLKQKEEERSESRSSSASPNEDMVRRRLRGRKAVIHLFCIMCVRLHAWIIFHENTCLTAGKDMYIPALCTIAH